MRRKRLLALALVMLILGSSCGRHTSGETEGDYILYFTATGGADHGAALAPQPWGPDGEERVDPGVLLQALMDGPTAEGLTSPFPKGLNVRWWEWDVEQPGNVRVGLSEQYSGVTDISLTLADYCIVLTLSQLPEVESVEIVSEGHAANYRSHQILLAEEAELTDGEAG